MRQESFAYLGKIPGGPGLCPRPKAPAYVGAEAQAYNRPMTARAPFLHVANGRSTTATIQAAGIPGLCSIWADPLHEGPVPHDMSDQELVDLRTQYLAGHAAGPPDPVNDLNAWRSIIEHDEAYDELVLWFEHDLFDQLNLVQLLTWLRAARATSRPVTLICIGSFPGRPNFKGLGELTTGELAPLLDARKPFTSEQYELAARCWDAFRQPSPHTLDALHREDTRALPFLSAAVVRWLQEYPWTTDGLSLTERRLLRLADQPLTLSSAFGRMSDGEHAYSISDLSLLSLATTLVASAPPLLTRSNGHDARGAARFAESIRITEAGQRVLAGEQDRIALCGIDRWLGGVQLRGHHVAWRWDPERAAIVNSPR